MSAAARAEARRKAILSRGTDRLAKLTTSARGEDAPSPSPPNRRATSPPSIDDSFSALLAAQAGGGSDGGLFAPLGPGVAEKAPNNDVPEPTKLQKAMPLLHVLAMWCLLAYFVLWEEPRVYSAVNNDGDERAVGLWRRWAELGKHSPLLENFTQSFRIQIMPFFWAVMTLQLALHSLRIFSGFNSVQPPILLSMALPHLPPPLPTIIVNSLKYMQMGSLFLDDLAGLIVGIGFIIYFSGWFTQS